MRATFLPALLLLLAARLGAQPLRGAELARVEAAASLVTIVRDRYGVPHVYAPTDAGVTLGVGYAQAEDHWWLLEEEYIRTLGRTAELEGESGANDDAAVRLARVVERAKARYAAATPAFRAVIAAYADGVNLWLVRHPGQARLIDRFEPWFPFAFDGGGGFSARTRPTAAAFGLAARGSDAARRAGDPPGEGDASGVPDEWLGRVEAPEGSNGWAIAPSRTTSGSAMLFINPHWNILTSGLRWEVHVESATGWRFSGFCILGNPIPRTGHNDRLGWTHTNLAGDFDDTWAVTFDHPTDSLLYRYDGGWKRAESWTDTVVVKTDAGTERRVLHLRRTHLGPVFAWTSPTRALVARTVNDEVTASALEQRYRMGRSRDFAEWKQAMAMRTFAGSYSTYADADGTIALAFGSAAPKRRAGVPWQGDVVLDGSDPTTEWLGLTPFEEMPLLVNPPAGFVQNTNSSPWHASADGSNLDSTRYAPYLVLDRDNPRSLNSRRLLGGARRFSFDDWARTTMDRRVWLADSVLPALLREGERLTTAYPGRALALRPLLDTLRAWDRVSDTTSVATTLFVHWTREMAASRPVPWDSAWRQVGALERARDSLVVAWRTWQVPWGRVNRIQRVPASGLVPFDTLRRSWGAPNIDGSVGVIMNLTTTPNATPARDGASRTTGRQRWGVAGNSYVGVVHFAPRVEARSLLAFGESADSTSRHYTDQAPLYVGGQYKPAWWYADDVQRNAERAYHPGGRDLARATVPGWAQRGPALPRVVVR